MRPLANIEHDAEKVVDGCAICGGPLTHDEVDNGVGMQQCGPAGCDVCQWTAPPLPDPVTYSPAVSLAMTDVPAMAAEIRRLRRMLEDALPYIRTHDSGNAMSLEANIARALKESP